MKVCPSCGEENPDRFRHCGFCGAALETPVEAPDTRRTVTVVFSDLKDSTALSERLDTEALRAVLETYFGAMQAVLLRHGGTVEKYIGDAIMAVFGLPAAHEDDPLRAVRAADEMRSRLAVVNDDLERDWGVRLQVRTGVNTGEVVAGDAARGQRLVTGGTVNMAARLEQAAGPSEILIGETTYALVRDAVDVEETRQLELKGFAGPVSAYPLASVTGSDGVARRPEAPLVGRRQEMATLRDALGRVGRDQAPRWVTILGPAGVGKSRLLDEFLASVSEGTILRGRCLSYGEGITFLPLADPIRAAASIDEEMSVETARKRIRDFCAGRSDIADRLAPLLGLSDDAFPLEETFWAVRRLMETLAVSAPPVVVFEDVHWAEVTFLDLIEDLARETGGPLLVVCTARDDVLEERPAWGRGSNEVLLRLEALGEAELRLVLVNLLGTEEVPPALVERLVRVTEGNPLFVEQTVSMLRDRGLLRQAADRSWSFAADDADASMPATIHALLSARIDQLGADDRGVLQAGSVIGLEFYRGAVAAMSAPEPPAPAVLDASLDSSIGTLMRRQLIRPIPSTFADESTFRFGHILIKDAAYGALLLRQRVDLHERFAAWLERAAGSRLNELEEIVGYHLEQGARCLAELGSLDGRRRTLAVAASERLAHSGARAFSRGDMPAAANLIERAANLLNADEPGRVTLLLELAEATSDLGESERAEAALDEALGTAGKLGDTLLETNAQLVRSYVHYTIDPEGRSDEVLRETQAAIPILEAAGDHAGLVRAWRLLAWVHGTACRYGAAEHAVSMAVEHARQAGDRRAVTRNQMSFAIAALYGPMPVPEAIALCDQIVADVSGDRRAEAVVLGALAHLNALAGEFDLARAQYGRAREVLEDLGGRLMAATVSLDSGRVELLAGRPDLAERELRHDYEVLAEIDERYALSTVAGLLALAVLAQGRVHEAMALTVASEEAAAEDDVESQNLWRRARARILVEQGAFDEAAALAASALEMTASTDAPLLQAGSRLDLALALAAAGRSNDAAEPARRALEQYVLKRDRVDVARAEGLLASLGGGR